MSMRLEIASPKAIVFEGEADLATLPGTEGDIGAQEGHAPVMIGLRPGVISLEHEGSHKAAYFVSGGFAEIGAEKTIVLVNDIKPVAELSVDAAQERLDRAMKAWTDIEDRDPQKPIFEKELRAAQAELEAAQKNASVR